MPHSPDISRIGRRQFIVADRPLCETQGWVVEDLGHNVFLSHCADLRVAVQRDLDGRRWALLGHALENRPSLPRPQDALCALHTADVFDQTFNWSGRWALVSSKEVLTDIGALLPVFYPVRNDASVYCSSSLAILAAFYPDLPRSKRRLGWYGMNWYAAPASQLAGIERSLPRQVLSLPERRASYISRLRLEDYAHYELPLAADLFAEALQAVLRRIADEGSLALALTSGLDSRTTLACLAASGLDFTTYTQAHPFISRGDLEIPPQLARLCGQSHRLIESNTRSKEREMQYDRHTHRNVFDADRYFYSHAMYEELRGCRLIRSNCYELGRRFYARSLGDLSLTDVVDAPVRIPRRLRTFAGAGETGRALQSWLDSAKREAARVDWRDLFYWEQRLGAWLADVEHSLDLNESLSFQPLNGALFYSLLLLNSDRNGRFQRQIIESRRPDLLDLPINPALPSPRTGRWARRARLLTYLYNEASNAARVAGASAGWSSTS